MNITLVCVFPTYFNATGLCGALEDHCGHKVTQFVRTSGLKSFYNWPLHRNIYDIFNMAKLRECISHSDFVIVCGAMVFLLWEEFSKDPQHKDNVYKNLDAFFSDIPDNTKTALIVSDSAILEREWTQKICRFDTVFAMPDLFDYVHHPSLYPALQTNDAFSAPQVRPFGEKVLIGHSPGNKMAKDRKGTSSIIEVLSEVRKDGFDFRFDVLTGLTNEECIKKKRRMDIFIDQLQDPPRSPVCDGMPPFLGALGKSGQEGMCSGCATITSGNFVSTEPYFPNPPMIIANTKAALKYEIENLLRWPYYRFLKAKQQYEWAIKYLRPKFVGRHIMKCIVRGHSIEKDMERINRKLDDSWNRYYGPGWPDLKARYNRIIKSVEKGPVLDIGCGPGVACHELRKMGYHVIGLDYSDKIIKIAKSVADGEFVHGRAEDLPFGNNNFNTLIMSEVLEHVEDENLAIAEADRVAAPGARIIVTVPNGGRTSRIHLRTFDENSLRKLLPWQIEEFEIMSEWIWAKCKKN